MKENKDWTEDIITSIANGKHFKSIFNTCIGHMPTRKLYKYYSFDSEYTLDNISNDIIYLSNPVQFNDPLDCNIGISVDSIMRILLPHSLDKTNIAMNDESYKLLSSLLFNEGDNDLQEDSKEAIIAECMKHPQLASLMQHQNNGVDITEDQFMDAIIDCPDILSKLIRIGYSNQLSSLSDIDLDEIMRFIMSSPATIRNLLGTVCDVKSDEKQIIEIISEDDDILQKLIVLSEYFGYPTDKSKIEEIYKQFEIAQQMIHTGIGDIFGVSCFTDTPTNMLMWSHYANKHSGICVEYDFGKLFSGNRDILLFPVSYSKKRPLLPLEKAIDFNNGNCTFDENRFPVVFPDIMKALIAKSDVWQYENEWRLIKSVKTNEDRIIHLPLISGIYTGVNISEKDLSSISSIAQQKNVPLHQCAMKNDRYKMVIKQ